MTQTMAAETPAATGTVRKPVLDGGQSLMATAVVVLLCAGVAAATKTATVGPWTIGLLGLLLAAAAGSGRLTLPANPLVRHVAVAVIGTGLVLLFADKVSSFSDFEISQVAYFLPAVAGLNLLTGHNGQLSLGHGALMAVGAYTVAVMMAHQPHVPIVVLLLAALVVAAAAGAVVGVAAARLRGPYLAGATLTLAVAIPDIANHFHTIFHGDQGLDVRPLTPPGWLSASFPAERYLAWVGIVCGAVVLVLIANLKRSAIGRKMRCVRDDEVAASLAGINVASTQVLAFVVSAACAGLAGALFGFANAVANPAAFDLTLSLSLLTAIVLGGLGSVSGSIVGALALVFVPHFSNSAADHLHLGTSVKGNLPLALYGVILVAAMLTLPGGVVGGLRRLDGLAGRRRPIRDNASELHQGGE